MEYEGPPLSQSLDIIWPQGQGPFPAVIVLHDGDFTSGSRGDVWPKCVSFAEHGYAAVAVDYRLAPRQQFPSPVHDIKAATRWLRAHAARYSVDPGRIAVVGYGTGGYLALFTALTQGLPEWEGIGPFPGERSNISCAASVGGFTDLSKLPPQMRDSVHAFIGGSPSQTPAGYVRANPSMWVTPDAAPLLLLQARDATSPDDGTQQLRDRLAAAGTQVEFVRLPPTSRPTPLLKDERADNRLIEFLSRHLDAKPAARVLIADHGPKGEAVILDWPSGRALWHVPNANGHDAQALPNGNVLLTFDREGRVVELDAGKQVVWQYGPGEGDKTAISAQRLENGNTLVADTGTGTVTEVTRDHRVVWTYRNPELANGRMRMCRRTPHGTTLIAVEAGSKIIEVDHSGNTVWSYVIKGTGSRKPYQAMRLSNGNTLISAIDPGEILEVARDGSIVRSIGGRDTAITLGWPAGFDLMPNGHLLIGDYSGQRLLEVGQDGKVVHELRVPYRPATIAVLR